MAILDGHKVKLFSLSANKKLAEEISEYSGIPLSKIDLSRFADGEIGINLAETVRGHHIFLVQPTHEPVNENIMELLITIDAMKRASAKTINVIMPYYGYSRQDRKARSRQPISAKLIANLLETAGTTRVLAMDLHASQIQGFFDIPVDNVYASPLTLADIWQHQGSEDLVVVSPDVGGVVRARAIAKRLDAELAIIDKRRPRANVAKVMNIIGDVDGKSCVMVDDMVDTAGTLCTAASALKEQGAVRVVAYCVHPVLSGPAIENIINSELDELVVTDTIPLRKAARDCDKIRQLSVSQMLAETIRRMAQGESVSSMYLD